MSHDTWVHRLVAPAVRPLAGTRVRPNHLTTARLATGLGAAGAFATGEAGWQAAGGGLFILSMLFDRADGMLARLAGATSRWGHVYDLAADYVSTAALFVGIGLGLAAGPLGWWAPVMGAVAAAAVTAIFWLALEVDRLTPAGQFALPGAGGFDPDDTLLVIGPVAWLGWLEPFLILAAIGAPLFAVPLALYYLRLRRRAALSPPR